jgi:two-component system sensor histidine kinase YesM
MRIYKNSIFVKFLTILFITIFLPVTFVSIIGYWHASKQMETQATEILFQIATDISNQIDKTIKDYAGTINQLIISKEFIDFLELRGDEYYETYQFSKWMDENVVQTFFAYKPYVCGIMIKNNYDTVYYYNRLKEDAFSGEEGMEIFSSLESQLYDAGKIQLFTFPSFNNSEGPKNKPNIVIMGRPAYSIKTLKPSGAFFLLFYTAELNQVWDSINLRGALVTIVGEKDNIIYHSNKPYIGKKLDDIYIAEQIQIKKGIIKDDEGVKYYLVSHTSDLIGWNTIVTIPVKQLMFPIDSIRNIIINTTATTFFISITLGYLFIVSILSPLRKLGVVMSKTGGGKWYSYQEKIPKDEIGYLINNYNSMVNRISELINKVYLTELEKKKEELARQEAEFQAMQAQINPHFLYNTLEAVNSYTLLGQKDCVQNIIVSLAGMFRYAVKNPLEMVELEEEISNTNDYLTIQKYRLGITPKVVWEIDTCRKSKIIRLTLQPIVENCFKHAFVNGVEPHHKIHISAHSKNKELYLTIEDNGLGTSLEVKNFNLNFDRKGIGLFNVSKRIQLIHGINYGLTISNKPKCGTSSGTIVCVKVPLI